MPDRFDLGYALLIGVGQVPNWEVMSLAQSVQDVQRVKEVLVDSRLCAYPDNEQHIRVIHDAEATSQGIIDGLEWLITQVDKAPGATAVVYFSGHGILGPENRYVLVSHNTQATDIVGTTVAFQDFAKSIKSVSCDRLLVVLDCCHAGAFKAAKGDRPFHRLSGIRSSTAPGALLEQLRQGKGRAVFCACHDGESSWVFKGKNISIFTHHFIEALRGSSSRIGEDVVSVSQLMRHVAREVPKSARDQWGESQQPFFDFATGDYPVALLRGGKGIPMRGDLLRQIPLAEIPDPEFGDYPDLARDYLSPWSVFDRVNLDRFRRREWLERRLDSFLSGNDRGLIIVEADAGLGKTAFLAHLVKQRGYVHHFVELAPGSDGVERGLRSLAAQLIRGWGLATDAVLPGDTLQQNFLENLLKQAADRRDLDRPGDPIVLAIDALDEAGPSVEGQNVLGLPRVLPRGVYLIVSQRPVGLSLKIETPRLRIPIDARGDDNVADMRAFLEEAAEWPGIRGARSVGDDPVSMESFAVTLLEKSKGIWIYLKYVLEEIEKGRWSPLELDELPFGLWQYYAKFWTEWKADHEQTWHALDLPLLATLAASQESLALEQLGALAGVESGSEIRAQIEDRLELLWRPFLAVSSLDSSSRSARTYRLYHASLRDFFTGSIDRKDFTIAEDSLVDRLKDATTDGHSRIADYFAKRWGGWDESFPALRRLELQRLESLDHYGLRHMAAHLEAAGSEDSMHRLLSLEWNMGRPGPKQQSQTISTNVWFTVRDQSHDVDGYLADVSRAWRLAERAFKQDMSPEGLKLQFRYALATASVYSLAQGMQPELLISLVDAGCWAPSKALAYARRMVPRMRCRCLIGLARYLDEPSRSRAIGIAEEVWDDDAGAPAMIAVARGLPEPRRTRLFRAALDRISFFHFNDEKRDAMAILLKEGDKALRNEVLSKARSIKSDSDRAEILTVAVENLDGDERVQVLPEILLLLEKLGKQQNEWSLTPLVRLATNVDKSLFPEAVARVRELGTSNKKAVLLAELAGAVDLKARERTKLLDEAVSVARKEGKRSPWERLLAIVNRDDGWIEEFLIDVLVAIARKLEEPERSRILDEALAAARRIRDKEKRAKILADLAGELGSQRRPKILSEVIRLARQAKDDWERAEILQRLAPNLDNLLAYEALNLARSLPDSLPRSLTLTSLGNRQGEPDRKLLLNEALLAARQIGDEPDRWVALAHLSSHLGEPERRRVIRLALSVLPMLVDYEDKIVELVDLARILSGEDRKYVMMHVPLRTWWGWWGANSDEAICELSEELEPWIVRLLLRKARTYNFMHHYEDLNGDLNRLARRMRGAERRGVIREVLASMRGIRDPDARLKALACDDRDSLYIEYGASPYRHAAALVPCGTAISPGATNVPLFSLLSKRLRSRVIDEAIKLARSAKEPWLRAYALSNLGQCLPEPRRSQILGEALTVARHIDSAEVACHLLNRLAYQLEGKERRAAIEEALESARDLDDNIRKAVELVVLSSHLEEPQRSQVRQEAIALEMSELASDRNGDDFAAEMRDDHAKALTSMALHLDGAQRHMLVKEAMDETSNIDDYLAFTSYEDRNKTRTELLRLLAPLVCSLPSNELFSIWCSTLRRLSLHNRRILLHDLRQLIPVVLKLGGPGGARDLAQSIEEAGGWWP